MAHIRHGAFLCLAIAFAACGPSESSVRLAVQYEEAWGLTELELEVEGETKLIGISPELLIWVKDEWVGHDITIEVTGLRDGERHAWGRVIVRPLAGTEIRAMVALSRLPCGAWCTEGATSCDGDNVVTCEEQEDGCFRWSARVPCSNETPYCSLGACRTECIDECAEGESRCAGSVGVEQCGRTAASTCLRWLPVMACANDEMCSNGQCANECRDECEEGDVQCRDGGLSRCADRDRNGCTEWGPSEPCGTGESCQAGSCRLNELCMDECSENACEGARFTRCGNFDADPCLEPSPGVSCVPNDECFEGQCTLSGCQEVAKVCDQPPASACVDSNTLRVYDGAGACSRGTCEYAPRDVACTNCPDCDACAGVTCNSPPNACFMSVGTCNGGVCTYAPANGADCDDGNACTDGDTCTGGVCAGTPRACNTTPAPTCVNASTLRTFMSPGTCSSGECNYPHADMSCASGCEAGACQSMLCSPTLPSCIDESILQLSLFANPNGALIDNEVDGRGFLTHVDATGGGPSSSLAYVYARFTDAGLVKVNVGDEAAFESTDWDIAFRRFVIRLNSGVSGPSCVTGARTASGTSYDALGFAPDGLAYRAEDYFSSSSCEFVPDGSGLGFPGTVLQSFWSYPGCVQMSGNVFVLRLANGRRLKLMVTSYYSPEVQAICDSTGSVPTGPANGAGHLRLRWAFLD